MTGEGQFWDTLNTVAYIQARLAVMAAAMTVCVERKVPCYHPRVGCDPSYFIHDKFDFGQIE